MAAKVGALIKEARTAAGLTQEKLARQIPGLEAADISAAERGVKDLSQEQLKAIAKATGVTQASLLSAAKAEKAPAEEKPVKKAASATKTAKSASEAPAVKAEKPVKTAKAEKPAKASTGTKTAKAGTAAASGSSAAKAPASANTEMKVTAAEKKLIEAYRTATAEQKKQALSILKSEGSDLLGSILGGGSKKSQNAVADSIADTVTDFLGGLFK